MLMPIVKYPSEGEPTKEVTAPVIVTKDGAQIVHEDAVTQIPKSVADHIIHGDIDPDATDKGGTQSVTDHIITGLTEANPSRDEGVSSVSEHVITGDVANGATDDGALQSPALPVKVSSGELGPSAVYSTPNWGINLPNSEVSRSHLAHSGASAFRIVMEAVEDYQVGDKMVVICTYEGTDYYASWQESFLNSGTYSVTVKIRDTSPTDGLFWMGFVTVESLDLDVQIELGPSSYHAYTTFRGADSFSEYF